MKAVIKFAEPFIFRHLLVPLLGVNKLMDDLSCLGGPRGTHRVSQQDPETGEETWEVRVKDATLQEVEALLFRNKYLFEIQEVIIEGKGFE